MDFFKNYHSNITKKLGLNSNIIISSKQKKSYNFL